VTFPLGPGDSLLFLTDGLVEAMNPKRRTFGIEGICRAFRRHRHLPASDVVDCLHRDVMSHTRPGSPHDDVTTVLLKNVSA
jgi:serine phosphatase RsbU (regulator of sigma subunit)